MSDDVEWEEREIKRYVTYNFQTDETNIRKTKPSKSKLSPYTICVKQTYTFRVPNISIPEISTTIEVPEAKVREAISDLAIDDAVEESSFPDPVQVLVSNDAEELEEKLRDKIGVQNVVDGEAAEALDWLYDLVRVEQEQSARTDVLGVLNDFIQDVREERGA